MSGDLVRKLDATETAAQSSAAVSKPVAGQRVRLWQVAGVWSCWSVGPKIGTRWLMPADDQAAVLVELLTDAPQRGYPVVQQVTSGAVLVACRDIRAGVARVGGQA